MRHLGRHVARLRECFVGLPDPCRGRNRRYAIALSVFMMQLPSFLAHQRAPAEAGGRCKPHFVCLARFPYNNHVRQRLDGAPTARFDGQFHALSKDLGRHGALAPMIRLLGGRGLVALDDTEFLRSRKIRFHNCSTRKRSNGTTEYFRRMLATTAAGFRSAPRQGRQAGPRTAGDQVPAAPPR